jgi:hypothetical protein
MPSRISARIGLSLATLALVLGGAGAAYATVDQQNTVATGYLGPSTSPGQSFTPTLTGIDFATFSLATEGPSSSLQVNLYNGDGFGGALLASTPTQNITNTNAFQPVTFDFSSTVALTPGNVYTLQIDVVSGADIFELEGSGNPYPGGFEYDSAGVQQTDYDLVFSEGVNVAATPEPSAIAFLLTGGVGAGIAFRRKRRR